LIKGLKTTEGTEIPFEQIDPVRDAAKFHVSPATLAYLKHDSTRRDFLRGSISASQWGKGLRQLFLEATAEVYVGAHDSLAALMGTSKHAHILTEGLDKGDVATEVRMFSKGDRLISGQADQIVTVAPGKVEIWDNKTGKKYSLKMYRTEIETHGYTYQLNLLADLYRMGNPGAEVTRLAIEWIPSDAGRGDEKLEIIDVPMWEYGRAFDAYAELLSGLVDAINSKVPPPVCNEEERWSRFDKKAGRIVNIKCEEYCSYAAACRAASASIDEIHPMDGSNV